MREVESTDPESPDAEVGEIEVRSDSNNKDSQQISLVEPLQSNILSSQI